MKFKLTCVGRCQKPTCGRPVYKEFRRVEEARLCFDCEPQFIARRREYLHRENRGNCTEDCCRWEGVV